MDFDDYTTEEHIDAAYKLGAKHERAAIVAWLRSHGFMALDEAADKIEVGEWKE